MIHVIATLEFEPGKRAYVLEEFKKIVPLVRAEAGCIEYGPVIDAETSLGMQAKIGPDSLMVIEKWETLEALKAHDVAPHMQDYRTKVKQYIRGREIRVLAPA
jgi:quinol monooxygenase YgiN